MLLGDLATQRLTSSRDRAPPRRFVAAAPASYHALDVIEPVCEGAMLTGWDTPPPLGLWGNETLPPI
eukprot:SAG11_NODE_27460_length_332_cov_1.077253_1_plen_66_part_01